MWSSLNPHSEIIQNMQRWLLTPLPLQLIPFFRTNTSPIRAVSRPLSRFGSIKTLRCLSISVLFCLLLYLIVYICQFMSYYVFFCLSYKWWLLRSCPLYTVAVARCNSSNCAYKWWPLQDYSLYTVVVTCCNGGCYVLYSIIAKRIWLNGLPQIFCAYLAVSQYF
jgi:hypothetical protein